MASLSAATATVWIFGDSTVKDYTHAQDACSPSLEIAGWGQYVQAFLRSDSLKKAANLFTADSVVVANRANGGRAARSFINGADSAVLKNAYANMKPGDYMFIQFGHNDEADCATYPDRCTSIPDFQKYLGMYVDSALKRGATPVLITPMIRYAWPAYNTHDNSDAARKNQQVGNFSLAMQQVAKRKGVAGIDLTQRSIDLVNAAGDTAAKYRYFREARPGVALPPGCASLADGTHFQPNGARQLARQVFEGLQDLYRVTVALPDSGRGMVTGYSNGVKNKANTAFTPLTNDFKDGSGWYEGKYNPSVKLIATPKPGYRFAGWSGDIGGGENPLTLAMGRNYSIVAKFVSAEDTSAALRKPGPVGSSPLRAARFDASGRREVRTLGAAYIRARSP